MVKHSDIFGPDTLSVMISKAVRLKGTDNYTDCKAYLNTKLEITLPENRTTGNINAGDYIKFIWRLQRYHHSENNDYTVIKITPPITVEL